MATHELRYWSISGSICLGSAYAFGPNRVEWVPEHLGYDLHSKPIYGSFHEVHWSISAMPYENRVHGADTLGGWAQLDAFYQSGSPLCLKTTPKGSLTPQTYSNVYLLKPGGAQEDINVYDVEVTFVRVEP